MAPRSVPRSERYDLPAEFIDLAERRTGFLFPHIETNMNLRMALACAWLQGARDAAQAIESARGRDSLGLHADREGHTFDSG